MIIARITGLGSRMSINEQCVAEEDQGVQSLKLPRGRSIAARMMAPSIRHMQVLQVISFAATLYALFWVEAPLLWWFVAIFAYFLTGCVGLTVTLHRALTHRSVIFPRPIEYLFTWMGIVGSTGSSIAWTAMHRAHHANVDGEADPHAPGKLGWSILFSVYDYEFNPLHAKHLLRDPVHLFFHRFYLPLLFVWGISFYVVHPNLFLFAFCIPIFLQITISNLTSVLTHSHGYRTFETKDESANNWLIALVAWGEGWHNNHHARPANAIFQHKWWEIDMGGVFIRSLAALGLARIVQ